MHLGDLFLADVRAYRDDLCRRLGWEPLYPAWGVGTRELAGSMMAQGFRAVVGAVDTTALSADLCGREFDARLD